jgi:hypothetical protein
VRSACGVRRADPPRPRSSIGAIIALFCCGNNARIFPRNYGLMAILTVAQGVMLGVVSIFYQTDGAPSAPPAGNRFARLSLPVCASVGCVGVAAEQGQGRADGRGTWVPRPRVLNSGRP